eukprot:5380593-Amphidinium_carterae.1
MRTMPKTCFTQKSQTDEKQKRLGATYLAVSLACYTRVGAKNPANSKETSTIAGKGRPSSHESCAFTLKIVENCLFESSWLLANRVCPNTWPVRSHVKLCKVKSLKPRPSSRCEYEHKHGMVHTCVQVRLTNFVQEDRVYEMLGCT